ncbi:MAG: 4-alpha-glucanotransferase [Chloroflexi bacterium]|nr:4-alpha-glucanotransferase [Chloroflexota bacterium]
MPRDSIYQLARLYGEQTSYYDVTRHRRQASPDVLLRVLRALGAPVETFRDVPAALRERREAAWKQCVEPVIVAWEGRPVEIELRLPVDQATASLVCHLELENGDVRDWALDVAQLPTLGAVEVEGRRYVVKDLPLTGTLPWGYHRLTLETQGGLSQAMVISAPIKAYGLPERRAGRAWGVAAPLYALHSRNSWGGGDLSDLESLMEWVAGLGGGVVATLPFLAAFLNEPFDPSPYAPASRLFWNEFYVDVTRAPELKRCPTAQAFLESGEVQRELEELGSSPLVDYRRQMALKRRVLKELALCFFAEASERSVAFRRFVEAHPALEDYARFRAVGERQRLPWPRWPQPLRDGTLSPGDYEEEAERYHLYAQWLAYEQLEALSQKATALGSRLYLDLPLGAHSDSYDVWREREAFALDVSVGAPPDPFCTKGQNWGFPPLHPEAIREQGYRYVIACLRHHLSHAGLLRIDHVMSLHRLFWVPKGLQPHEGAYVRYPAEELYAILSLESHRYKSGILGENLGIVPSYVNASLAKHYFYGMYVLEQCELVPDSRRPLRVAPRRSVASLNTHDMPPFAAYWRGMDIEDRLELGLLDNAGAQTERETRQAIAGALVGFLQRKGRLQGDSVDDQAVLRACLALLATTPSQIVLVNLEDLWLETKPQNVPGTGWERPNWRRRAQYSLEALRQMPEVLDALREVDRLRKRSES